MPAPPPPIEEVIRQYEEERYYSDDRRAAEFAYALAVRYRELGVTDEARKYAKACLELLEQLPSKTLDDVQSEELTVGGVPLPELFHDGVVRVRLRDLLPA
jgi:hypothetical protein